MRTFVGNLFVDVIDYSGGVQFTITDSHIYIAFSVDYDSVDFQMT